MHARPASSLFVRSLFLLAPAGLVLTATPAHALDPFTDGSDLLNNPMLASGVAIGVTDMDGDGLDDLVRLDRADSLEIEYQQEDGSFRHYVYGEIPGGSWGLALGDIDRNGYVDIFTSGAYNGIKIFTASDTGESFDLEVMNSPSVFTQCANFADIDNNGTLDLFVCHDDGISAPLNNDGEGNFSYDLGLINPASTVPSDNSGNYGTVWTDYDSDGDLDLYIAKCRLFVDNPDDGRRLNLLFENDGAGNYTDVAPAMNLQPGGQSWAADFGDIDNDGDMDMYLINHDIPSTLYENQGADGKTPFVDITDSAGMVDSIASMGDGIQAHFEDFDNDTFLDLLVTGNDGQHRLFINNGENGFVAEEDPFPTGGPGIQSAVVGDLNADGFPDILAGFATGFNNPSPGAPDRLYFNPGNDNNWLDIRLTGVESNASAVGARIELHGPWGVMVREVRAGEGYGINHSLTRHFGLGTNEAIDSIEVHWPSGHVDTMDNPAVLNETVHIVEGCGESFYADADADGFGDPATEVSSCLPPEGFIADGTDCDDTDPAVNPAAAEVCDEVDNNCNMEVDEGLNSCDPGSDSTGAGSATGVDESGGVTDPTGSGSGGTGDDTAGGDDDSSGCGCSTDASQGRDTGFTLLALGLLLGLRRRRFGVRAN